MQKIYFIFIALWIMIHCNAQTAVSQFLFKDKKAYLIQNNQLFEVSKKNELTAKISFNNEVNDAIIQNDEIWVAGSNGLSIYNLSDYRLKKSLFENDKIVGITKDADDLVWLVSFFNGAYKQSSENPYAFNPIFKATVNYTIQGSKDRNMYIGTDYGLYRIMIDTNDYVRYTEEAHSGHGLPDNLVEKLFVDDLGNIWVVMPEHITYIKDKGSMSEFPTFSYVGDQSNKVRQIFRLKNDQYLMLTDLGSIVLNAKELNQHEHAAEIFNPHETAGVLLNNALLKAPEDLKNKEIITVGRGGKHLYFLTENGIWKVKEKKILKAMAKMKL
ncbi:hypothetical protein GO491_06795 [Flavobacteriaceae bacterium Ap0902]|nr:hypothetical protein [Flavobacteriaceae bacterium Ap0902]